MGLGICEGCKKKRAVCYIRGEPVCAKCFSLLRLDNSRMLGKRNIPRNLNLYKVKMDRILKKQYSAFLKLHKALLNEKEDAE